MNILDKIDRLVEMGRAEKQGFSYSIKFLNNAVAAGTTANGNRTISSDAHFLARFWCITVYTSAPNIPVQVFTGMAPLEIALVDTGSGRNLQDDPQAIQNLCGGVAANGGNGSLPMVFPDPWLIRAASTLQCSIVNLGILTFPRVTVSFIGFKVYRFGGGGPVDLDQPVE